MWNLVEALELIREIQSKIRELDYHILLGGGVLNKGTSEKDLDLFFIPLNGYDGQHEDLIIFLFNRFGYLEPIRDSPDYGPEDKYHFRNALMKKYEKRIDFFIQ